MFGIASERGLRTAPISHHHDQYGYHEISRPSPLGRNKQSGPITFTEPGSADCSGTCPPGYLPTTAASPRSLKCVYQVLRSSMGAIPNKRGSVCGFKKSHCLSQQPERPQVYQGVSQAKFNRIYSPETRIRTAARISLRLRS